jgi:hypothetical protein
MKKLGKKIKKVQHVKKSEAYCILFKSEFQTFDKSQIGFSKLYIIIFLSKHERQNFDDSIIYRSTIKTHFFNVLDFLKFFCRVFSLKKFKKNRNIHKTEKKFIKMTLQFKFFKETLYLNF